MFNHKQNNKNRFFMTSLTLCKNDDEMFSVGLLSVEFVLGINGATMGTLICYIFPAMFFLNVMATASEGKWTARVSKPDG